jgi:DNA-binding response OmpR family regulator
MAKLSAVRFLIVDDNAAMRRIVRMILADFGVRRVEEAGGGMNALTRMQADPADIVITDCNMPDLNGVEFVRRLRAQEVTSAAMTPVIMLTAHAQRSFVIAARDAGVTEFCAKPVTAANLWKRIVSVIDKPRPFVKAGVYFGPCRRRRIEINGVVLERRGGKKSGAAVAVKETVEI